MLETCLFNKMHGSWHGSKAFQGKLWIIEAVDLKFTSSIFKLSGSAPSRIQSLVLPQSFNTSGSSFPANLG
jgi:hypothetical protein